MLERDTSGVPRTNDVSTKATGAAPGGTLRARSDGAAVYAVRPRRCPLEFLLTFIRRLDPGERQEEQRGSIHGE
jgi:hypothetical protein